MYEASFGFKARPFAANPKTEQYCPNESSENARHTIARCIEREEGPALLVGAAGSGKTLLCKILASHFQNTMRVAPLAGARICTRRALLQSILLAMKLPYRGLEEDDLRLQLIEAIRDESAGLLLVVDEAQTLPLRLLDELKMLTNVDSDGHSLIQLVLAGDARLEERFTNPKIESFNQRLAARCYLSPLTREETKSYVRQQILLAGGEAAAIFSDDALNAIYTASHGTPRIINQVCDHTLLLGSLSNVRPLGEVAVEEAWADLQQLPAPIKTPQEEDMASIIEFGALEEDDLEGRDVESDNLAIEPPDADSLEVAAEDSTLAPLHIAAESLAADDPARRLENIEQVVATVQNDDLDGNLADMAKLLLHDKETEVDSFRPAGIVGPETEIIFHGAHNPFDDDFQEEEIVIDHYVSLDSGDDIGLVRVNSDESLAIARLLDQSLTQLANDSPPEEATPDRAMSSELEDARPAAQIDPAAQIEEPPAVAFSIIGDHDGDLPDEPRREQVADSSDDHSRLEAVSPVIETGAASFAPQEVADPVMPEYVGASLPENSVARSNAETIDAAQDDRDLIVVENEDDTPAANPTLGSARRMEYRRLFAKLRRG